MSINQLSSIVDGNHDKIPCAGCEEILPTIRNESMWRGCKSVFYHSRQCQINDWEKRH